MSSNPVKKIRNRNRNQFVQVLIIIVILNLIFIFIPIVPITDVTHCFTSSCDPNITFESIWERYN